MKVAWQKIGCPCKINGHGYKTFFDVLLQIRNRYAAASSRSFSSVSIPLKCYKIELFKFSILQLESGLLVQAQRRCSSGKWDELCGCRESAGGAEVALKQLSEPFCSTWLHVCTKNTLAGRDLSHIYGSQQCGKQHLWNCITAASCQMYATFLFPQ